MEFVPLKSPSMMPPSSPNSVQSFDSAEVINIHELAELIGPPSCIITEDWPEELRLRWTRAGEAARPRESRVHTSRPGLLCNRAAPRGAHEGLGWGASARARQSARPPASPALFSSQPPLHRRGPPLLRSAHPPPTPEAAGPRSAAQRRHPPSPALRSLGCHWGASIHSQPRTGGRPRRPDTAALPGGPFLAPRPAGHIPWGPGLGGLPDRLTHWAAAAAPWGPLALLQAQLATPARGCTGLIKAVRAESQEPAPLFPGKAAAPPPPPSHTLLPSPTFLRLPLPSALPLRRAPRAHSPGGRRAAWSPGGPRTACLLRPRAPNAHFAASWVSGDSTPGSGVQGGGMDAENPQSNQASGRFQHIRVQTRLSRSPRVFLTSRGQSWRHRV